MKTTVIISALAAALVLPLGCALPPSDTLAAAEARAPAHLARTGRTVLIGDVRAGALPQRASRVDAVDVLVAEGLVGTGGSDGESEGEGDACPPPPPSVSFDVTRITPTAIDLTWQAVSASGCAISDATTTFAVANLGALTRTTQTESGLVTYLIQCAGDDGANLSVSRTVRWGDVTSVQDIVSVRALVGSLFDGNDDFITDFTDTDLKLVSGAFEIHGDPNSSSLIALSFPSLKEIHASLVIVDNAFSSISFESLESVGTGIDLTGNAGMTELDFPALHFMGQSSDFAVRFDSALSCAEIADMYCRLDVRGAPLVDHNAEASCDLDCP